MRDKNKRSSPMSACGGDSRASHYRPGGYGGNGRDDDKDEDGPETSLGPFDFNGAYLSNDLLTLRFCLFWHPRRCISGGCGRFAKGRKQDEGAEDPKRREY